MKCAPLLLCVLVACSGRHRAPEYAEMAYDGYSEAPRQAAAPSAKARAAYEGAPPPPAAPAPSADAAIAVQTGGGAPPGEAGSAAAPAAARMVHYQGYAALRVGRTEQAVDAAVALAAAAGGGLERQYGDTLVLRVPVARFREVFDAVLALGDVVEKSIAAEDVTDAFLSVELRLRTATARRDRLVALLAQSKEENEKLALVREIQEVTEEIDRLEQQSRTLRALGDFSRITLQLTQRPALTWQGGAPEAAAFAWIRALGPFEEGPVGKALPLDAPEGFVPLDVRRRFVAESADGARTWSTRLVNDPDGSTAFWVDALGQRLGPEFASATPIEAGAWRGLRFVDRSATPYTWVVLLRADGKHLDVVQAFYPSAAAEERHAPAVRATLTAGGAA